MLGPDTRASSKLKTSRKAIDASGSHQSGKHLLGPSPGVVKTRPAGCSVHDCEYDASYCKYLLTTTSGVPETPQWFMYGPYDHITRSYHAHAVFRQNLHMV